jgi:Fungal potassium channel
MVVAWLRIVFAEGPRQVVNALTLYSVMRLNLIPEGEHAAKEGRSPVIQFFVNISVLANHSTLQAVILFGMLFTLVIWVISAINLAVAVLMYLLFLFHHVPSADGSLSKYCRRKINDRAEKVIGSKMKKALERENRIKMRGNETASPVPGQVKRQPTLPVLDTSGDDKLPGMPMLSRTTTSTTLPPYSSSPPSAGNLDRAPTLPDFTLDTKRPPTSRTATMNSARSTTSYDSNAPLLSSANDMGYSSNRNSPMSPVGGIYPPMPMNRNASSSTQGSGGQRSYPPSYRSTPSSQGRRTPGADGYPPRGPPLRTNTGMSNMSTASTGRRPTPGPSPMDRSFTPAMPPPSQNSSWPLPAPGTAISPVERTYNQSAPPAQNSAWPLSSPDSAAPGPQPSRTPTPGGALNRNPSTGQGFVAFNPSVHASNSDATPAPTSTYSSRGTYRGVNPSSATSTSPQDYFSAQPQSQKPSPMPRSGTAPPTQNPNQTRQKYPSNPDDYTGAGYDDFLDDYASNPAPAPAPVAIPAPVVTSRRSPPIATSQPVQYQSRPIPPRAATSSPSAQQQQQRSVPPRSATTTPGSNLRAEYQAQEQQQPQWPSQSQLSLPQLSQQPSLPQFPQKPSLPQLQTQNRPQSPAQPRSQTPQSARPQTPQPNGNMKHQTLKEQLAQGGQDWRANDGKSAVQGGGSSNVFDW